MKKLTLFTLLFIFYSVSVKSQNIKPEKGDWVAEVNFSPFSSSPVSINYLRARKFIENKKAFRLGVFLGADIQKPDEDQKNSTFEINIRPGIEMHFDGTEKLSPYIGGELDLAYKKSGSTFSANANQEFTIEGAWSSFGQERGFYRIGLNAIAGADFYIARQLYLGTEFGFGFEFIKQADIVEKFNGTATNEVKGGSTFQLGPNFNSALRLGFKF
ncbi:MAG: hypothetical protein ROO71_07365 [Balneola sp.]